LIATLALDPAPSIELLTVCGGVRASVMNIYVGNLSYGMSETELRDAFAAFGEVSSAKLLIDSETGRSRGFGFVEMPHHGEAEAAIAQLNGKISAGARCASASSKGAR
jgi:RNA recognition motif-containing protein